MNSSTMFSNIMNRTILVQTRYMGTGTRGARGHGWLKKYRDGLGERHLQGRFHKRNVEHLNKINDQVFSLNGDEKKIAYLDFKIGEGSATAGANDEDVSMDTQRTIKRVTIELATAALPQTCDNFIKLCTTNDDNTHKYMKSKIFKIEPKVGICLGDLPDSNGKEGQCHPSINGGLDTFPDEAMVLTHSQKGIVSMLSTGVDKNDSRFFITTVDDAPHLDGRHVAFGRVKEGLDALEEIVKNTYTKKGRPTVDIQVVSCGTL
jgi:cyclophilin family peptidyl-prolyl cis-trans isomerase